MEKNRILFFYFIYCLSMYTVLFSCQSPSNTLVEQKYKYSKELFDKSGKPSKVLSSVLQTTGIRHNDSFESIVSATQKFQYDEGWRRHSAIERFQSKEMHPEKRDILMPLFKRLNIVDALYPDPEQKNYEYCIFFAAWIKEARRRQKFLFDLWNNCGIRAHQLWVLTGVFNPFVQESDIYEKLKNRNNGLVTFKKNWIFTSHHYPETETQMLQILFDQAQTPEDEDWKKLEIHYTDTKVPRNKTRTTTNDTIKDFFSRDLKPGSILAISSQPYLGYQKAGLQTYMSEKFKKFTLTVVGPAADEKTKISVYLDSLTKWMWQEQEAAKKV